MRTILSNKNRLGKKLRLITLMHNQYSECRNIYHPDPQNVLQNYFDSPPYDESQDLLNNWWVKARGSNWSEIANEECVPP